MSWRRYLDVIFQRFAFQTSTENVPGVSGADILCPRSSSTAAGYDKLYVNSAQFMQCSEDWFVARHDENGVSYAWNIEVTMSSKGNVTEKQRVLV